MAENDVQLQLTCDVSIDEESNKDTIQYLAEEMMAWERNGTKVLQPAVVYSDCPYASEVEFGTGPGNPGHGTSAEQMSKMELWVEKRLKETDGKRKHAIAIAMMNKINKEGIAPSPYFRSSIDMVLRDRCPEGDHNATDYLEEGGSIPELAKEIENRIKSTLELNQMIITHTLIDSIKSESLNNYSIMNGEIIISENMSDDSITEDMWKDKSLGRKGKRPTRFWRYPS